MKNRRPITEDDIYLTELLIAKSYGKLKGSVARATSDTISSVGETLGGSVRRHPYATAGAAAGAGILLFMLFRLMNGGRSSRHKGNRDREQGSRSGMTKGLLGMLMPMVAPYVMSYAESYLERMFSRSRD